MDDEKFLFSQQDCSKIVGISPQNFLRLNATLKKEDGREKFYDIREVVSIATSKKTQSDLDEARTKLANEQAAKVKIDKQVKKIELEEKKKNLISAKEVEKVLTNMIMAFRAKILNIPTRCASTVVSLHSEIEVEEFLRGVLSEALEELSNWNENQKSD